MGTGRLARVRMAAARRRQCGSQGRGHARGCPRGHDARGAPRRLRGLSSAGAGAAPRPAIAAPAPLCSGAGVGRPLAGRGLERDLAPGGRRSCLCGTEGMQGGMYGYRGGAADLLVLSVLHVHGHLRQEASGGWERCQRGCHMAPPLWGPAWSRVQEPRACPSPGQASATPKMHNLIMWQAPSCGKPGTNITSGNTPGITPSIAAGTWHIASISTTVQHHSWSTGAWVTMPGPGGGGGVGGGT